MRDADATASPIDAGAFTLEQQATFFHTFGALRVRGLFAAEISAISSAFDEVFRQNPVHEVTSPFSLHRVQDPQHGAPRRQIPAPDVVEAGDPSKGFIEHNPKLAWLRDDPRVTNLAAALLGDGYTYDGSVGNIFNSYIYWHSDYFRSVIPPETRLKFAFYLDPLDADSGTLRVIPGSNHLGSFRDLLYDEIRETKLGHLERLFGVAEDDLPCWAIAVEPGDLVVFDNTTLHANFNGGPHRRLFTIGFSQAVPEIPDIRTPGESGDTSATYRPHLDGLHALAVYLVVLFHAGSGVFSGGYIGVDVFFVLSGFLVTQLLLRDITGRGSIRFGRFYARRFRRLLPAAFVALIVTAIVFAAIASPAEVRDAAGSFKAAFLYVTNFYFIHQSTGYFGANLTANPVLQFWSLAVEEQFYLLWPLAIGAGFLFTRRLDRERQLQVLGIAVLVGAIASAVWALSLRNTNPNRAYYGTDARAYELFAGALLALTPAVFARAKRYHRGVHAATVVSLVALIAVATSWVHLDAIERGVVATLITAALLVAIESAGDGIVNRALSNNTVVYLGKVSYGTYLWHWIVILVAVRTFDPSVTATIAIAALVATALAALSYEILERPVRISALLDRHRRVVIATGLAVSLVSALVFIPRIMNPAHAKTPIAQGSTTAGFTPVPAGLDWEAASKGGGPFINCLGRPASACTVVHGTGRSVLLIGDSNAWMMIPAFEEIARRENLTLSVAVHGGCPWQRDLYVYPITVNGQKLRTEDCRKEKDDLYSRVIPALHPDLIVAMQVSHESPGLTPFLGPDGNALPDGSPAAIRWVEQTTKQSVRALRAPGRKLLIIEPIPSAPFDPIACISKAKVLETCRFVASTTPDPVERYYRKLARTDSFVHSADFDRLACPYLPICDPVVNGQIVRRDGSHLSVKFVETLVPAIDAYLKNAGLIPS